MPTVAYRKRVITHSDRPWAFCRKYQQFLGVYVEDPESGLYFCELTAASSRARISRAFLGLSDQLQNLCLQYQVTFSTCPGWTINGNSSSLYSNFKESRRERISPHIEMSFRSLTDDLLVPHLVHEVCHIWWRHQSVERRRAYTQFLVDSCSGRTIEVSEYVQEFFADWRRSLEIPDSESYAQNHRACYLEQWAEESFCDTVAKLVAPNYRNQWRGSNVNLELRRAMIKELMLLDI